MVHREQEREDTDAQFESGVELEGSWHRVDLGSEPGVAQGEPAHEGRQDRDDGIAGVAEEEGEVAGPDDLVDEAGDARHEEGGQHQG